MLYSFLNGPTNISVTISIGQIKEKHALIILYLSVIRSTDKETVSSINKETIKKYIAEQYERQFMKGDYE